MSVPVTLTSTGRSRASCTTSLTRAKETTPAELTNAVIRGLHPSISATVASIEGLIPDVGTQQPHAVAEVLKLAQSPLTLVNHGNVAERRRL